MVKTKVATLNDLLATRARARFPYRINFSSARLDNIEEMKEWCQLNCRDIWRCESYFAIYFQFGDDYDATMFALKWAGNGNTIK
jgi:hypothetical protein